MMLLKLNQELITAHADTRRWIGYNKQDTHTSSFCKAAAPWSPPNTRDSQVLLISDARSLPLPPSTHIHRSQHLRACAHLCNWLLSAAYMTFQNGLLESCHPYDVRRSVSAKHREALR